MRVERSSGRGKPIADGFMHIMHARKDAITGSMRHVAVAVGKVEIHLSPKEIAEIYDYMIRNRKVEE
jgi:hypothetical protein